MKKDKKKPKPASKPKKKTKALLEPKGRKPGKNEPHARKMLEIPGTGKPFKGRVMPAAFSEVLAQ